MDLLRFGIVDTPSATVEGRARGSGTPRCMRPWRARTCWRGRCLEDVTEAAGCSSIPCSPEDSTRRGPPSESGARDEHRLSGADGSVEKSLTCGCYDAPRVAAFGRSIRVVDAATGPVRRCMYAVFYHGGGRYQMWGQLMPAHRIHSHCGDAGPPEVVSRSTDENAENGAAARLCSSICPLNREEVCAADAADATCPFLLHLVISE